ncbi:sulfatase [Acidobacteriota bacterium]
MPYLQVKTKRGKARSWLDKHGGDDRPFFLLCHYFDPHDSYVEHPDRWSYKPYEGPVQKGVDIRGLRDMRMSFKERDIERLVELYDGELAFTDHYIGILLDHLGKLGLTEKTVIVVTADHGEEFMERGWIGHTRTLFEEIIRVPLIIKAPHIKTPHVIKEDVRLVDMVPTLLDLAGQPDAVSGVQGTSLVPLLNGESLDEPLPVFAEVAYVPDPWELKEKTTFLTSMKIGRHKLIENQLTGNASAYDLENDPREIQDLALLHSPVDNEILKQLRSRLLALSRSLTAVGPEVSIDEETRDKLRALGYLE